MEQNNSQYVFFTGRKIRGTIVSEKEIVKPKKDKKLPTGFIRVPASKLSLDERWIKSYNPKEEDECFFERKIWLKQEIERIIRSGVKDFYRPKYDPSFCKDGTKICYVRDAIPATIDLTEGCVEWWEKAAHDFAPEWNSRLGTKDEYIIFLGVLIKKLVASGWGIKRAWNAVCEDSKELGHYINSENSVFIRNRTYKPELTGSRKVCGFCDLANLGKILAKEKEGNEIIYRYVNTYFHFLSHQRPLARVGKSSEERNGKNYVGWIVLECEDEE